MSFFSGDIQQAQSQVPLGASQKDTVQSKPSESSTSEAVKFKIDSTPFGYQLDEVDTAISTFAKHQPYNHHYAPNVNLNRNHSHSNNHNSNYGHHQHHHHNNSNNNNYNNNRHNYNNGRYNNNNNHNNNHHHHHQHQPQPNFALNAQLKQQQHQQLIANHNPQQRFKQFNGVNNNNSHNNNSHITNTYQQHQIQQPVVQSQEAFTQPFQQFYNNQQPLQQQQPQNPQYFHQIQQAQQQQSFIQAQTQQQQQFRGLTSNNNNNAFSVSGNTDLGFDTFQHHNNAKAQPQLSHVDLINPLRSSTSPTFPPTGRPGSAANAFGTPLEQINTGSSFGLSNSEILNTPMTNVSSNGELIDRNISLDDSTNSYLGDIWGNSKGLKNSTSVWA